MHFGEAKSNDFTAFYIPALKIGIRPQLTIPGHRILNPVFCT